MQVKRGRGRPKGSTNKKKDTRKKEANKAATQRKSKGAKSSPKGQAASSSSPASQSRVTLPPSLFAELSADDDYHFTDR